MGAFRSIFEFCRPNAPEYLARLEARWKSESIPGIDELIIDPNAVYSEGVSLEGPMSYRGHVRDILARQNGKRLEPFSCEETKALTAALELRFAEHLLIFKQAQDYALASTDEDFGFQQRFLDEQEKILRGYVNLIAAINHETLAQPDPENETRVFEFLEKYIDEIADMFSRNGGVDALLKRTKHVDQSNPVMQRLTGLIDAKVFDGPQLVR
ncbi:MAG: hypothetical protein U0R17_07120 [Acidimicrobiia bacterium]